MRLFLCLIGLTVFGGFWAAPPTFRGEPSGQCSVTIQQVTPAHDPDRWWWYVGAAFFNHLSRSWSFIVFDGLDGFWYVQFQANSDPLCQAITILMKEAGYRVY